MELSARAALINDINNHTNGPADEDEELQQRAVALSAAVVSWTEKYNDVLASKFAEAAKEASKDATKKGAPPLSDFIASPGKKDTGFESDSDGSSDTEASDGEEAAPGRKRKSAKKKTSNTAKKGRPTEPAVLKKVKAVRIQLPSHCVTSVSRQKGLKAAKIVEVQLRRAQANYTLNTLRTRLITDELLDARLQAQSQRGQQKKRSTRYAARVARRQGHIRKAAAEYRRAYTALVKLQAADEREFKRLQDKDIRPFVVRTEDQRLGDSKVQPSRIWQKLSFLDTAEVTANFTKYSEAGERY